MDQPTPPKRKPGRPRKQKPATGTQTPSAPESNPLEATIKAARQAYEPNRGTQSYQAPNSPETLKEAQAYAKQVARSTDKELGIGIYAHSGHSPTGSAVTTGASTAMGAIILPTLPEPRTRGKVTLAVEYVKALSDEHIERWAMSWIATGNRQRYLCEVQPAIGRENQRWRSDLVHELERHPVALETIARLKEEQVMSDLQRRKLLRQISEAESHPIRGDSDRIQAIKVDAELDPESTPNRLKQQKAEAANSLTFNAPVSLFFMPSTQARAISPAPEPKQAEAIEVQTKVATCSLPSSLPLPLPGVGGTPAD